MNSSDIPPLLRARIGSLPVIGLKRAKNSCFIGSSALAFFNSRYFSHLFQETSLNAHNSPDGALVLLNEFRNSIIQKYSNIDPVSCRELQIKFKHIYPRLNSHNLASVYQDLFSAYGVRDFWGSVYAYPLTEMGSSVMVYQAIQCKLGMGTFVTTSNLRLFTSHDDQASQYIQSNTERRLLILAANPDPNQPINLLTLEPQHVFESPDKFECRDHSGPETCTASKVKLYEQSDNCNFKVTEFTNPRFFVFSYYSANGADPTPGDAVSSFLFEFKVNGSDYTPNAVKNASGGFLIPPYIFQSCLCFSLKYDNLEADQVSKMIEKAIEDFNAEDIVGFHSLETDELKDPVVLEKLLKHGFSSCYLSLNAISFHVGRSTSSGHYVTSLRVSESEFGLFDDSKKAVVVSELEATSFLFTSLPSDLLSRQWFTPAFASYDVIFGKIPQDKLEVIGKWETINIKNFRKNFGSISSLFNDSTFPRVDIISRYVTASLSDVTNNSLQNEVGNDAMSSPKATTTSSSSSKEMEESNSEQANSNSESSSLNTSLIYSSSSELSEGDNNSSGSSLSIGSDSPFYKLKHFTMDVHSLNDPTMFPNVLGVYNKSNAEDLIEFARYLSGRGYIIHDDHLLNDDVLFTSLSKKAVMEINKKRKILQDLVEEIPEEELEDRAKIAFDLLQDPTRFVQVPTNDRLGSASRCGY